MRGRVAYRQRPTWRSETILCVGGDDLALRLPFLRAVRSAGLDVEAVGSGESRPFEEARVPFHRVELTRHLAPLDDLRTINGLRALAARLRPAIVHGFDTKPGLMTPLAVALAGCGCAVRTINGLGRTFAPTAGGPRLMQLAYCLAQRVVAPATELVIFQNQADRAFFKRHRLVPDERAVLIPGSGVDTEAFSRAAVDPAEVPRLRKELGLTGKIVVTCVSRLNQQKGVRTLLASAALLAHQRDDVVILLVGSQHGEGCDAVPQDEIARFAPVVRAVGHRTDVAALLAASDVFVLPTGYGEGIPRALLEAGAMELPLITTCVPGCTDVLEHGASGLIIEPGDPRALAGAVARLAACADERRRMGEQARRRVVETFSLERTTAAHIDIYERLLKQ